MYRTILTLLILLIFTNGCGKDNGGQKTETGTFTDSRDGQVYKTIKVGDTWWMAENLNFHTETGSYCYDENPESCKEFGILYDWETASKLATDGWTLPTKDDFVKLIETAGGKLNSYNNLIVGGKSAFNAVYAGGKFGESIYKNQGESTFFWSLNPDTDEKLAWCMGLEKDLSVPTINNYNKTCAFSVRLIKK